MENTNLNRKTLATQIKEDIFKKIENREFSEKGQLPNESLLAEMYGVSRITIRDSLASLEQEGYISRFPGKGTFANYGVAQIKSRLSTSYNFQNLIEINGFTSSVNFLGVTKEPMSPRLLKEFKLTGEHMVYIRKQLFLADGKPAIYCENYIGDHLVDDSFLEIGAVSGTFFFKTMRADYGFPKMSYDVASIIPIVLSKWLAQMFASNQYAPGLLVEALSYNESHQPFFFSKEFYNTEVIKFNEVRMVEY